MTVVPRQEAAAEEIAPVLTDLLEERADERPGALAVGLLRDGQSHAATATYAELAARVRGLATALAGRLSIGDRALLLYSSPLDFLVAFLGCVEAGVIAIPAPPPEASRLKRTLPRLVAIGRDSAAAAILADPPVLEALSRIGERIEGLGALPALDTTAIPPADARPVLRGLRPDVAYLQYTSGSIGDPKGARITHAGVLANLAYNHRLWAYGPDSAAVHWMPYFHDYGLVEGLLQPLSAGIPVHVMPTVAFLRQPRRWLEAIGAFRATHSASPNFGYDHCVDRIDPALRAGLDLSSWRVASNGAEVVRHATLERFAAAFGGAGFDARAFSPSYGLAEATLLLSAVTPPAAVTTFRADVAALAAGRAKPAAMGERAITLVGCGRSGPGVDLRVVDRATGVPCPEGTVGEILARGAAMADGYWERPEETARSFDAVVPGSGGGFLRTGDLGFFHHGELFVTGRAKDLIVVRGANHAPEDIEATARTAHPALAGTESAAFPILVDGRETVAVVSEIRRDARKEEMSAVADALRAAVADAHELQVASVVFVRRGAIPKTSSGKIQRGACRRAFEAGAIESEIARFDIAEAGPLAGCETRNEERAAEIDGSRARADAAIAGLRALAVDRIDLHLMDERRTPPPHVVLAFGNLGLLGLSVPVAEGGLGLTMADAVRVVEQIGAIDISLGVFTILQNGLGLRPLMKAGRPEQLAGLLPALASGRGLVAFAYTERAAGSNVRGIEAEARPDPAGVLRLAGTKVWSGSSAWADTILTFAREFDAAGAPRGISAFVLRRGMPGLSTGDESLTMGMRATIQNRVHLDGVAVTDADRLGAAGEGLAVAQDAMMTTRLYLAALCLGAMKRALRMAHGFASGRIVITGRLADHPLVRRRLSSGVAAVRCLEALVARTAALEDEGGAPVDLLTTCKVLAPELLWSVADDAMQTLGGRGYMEHNLLAILHRDARAIRIFEGPTEVLRHHLGGRLLGETDAVVGLIERLGEHALAARLRWFAKEQAGRVAPPTVGSEGGDRLWRLQAAGEVTARALLAAVAATERVEESGRSWALGRLDEAIAEAERHDADDLSIALPEALETAIEGFSQAIGDGRYGPPGVECEPDPLIVPSLATKALPAAVAPASVDTAPLPDTGSGQGRSAAELASWISAWMARTLGLPVSHIAPERPFAGYGLDSVMASNLALDLETELDRPVDATLIWDRPSIAALAAHLAAPAGQAQTAARPAPEPPRSAAEELDRLLAEFGHL